MISVILSSIGWEVINLAKSSISKVCSTKVIMNYAILITETVSLCCSLKNIVRTNKYLWNLEAIINITEYVSVYLKNTRVRLIKTQLFPHLDGFKFSLSHICTERDLLTTQGPFSSLSLVPSLHPYNMNKTVNKCIHSSYVVLQGF